MAWFHEQKNRLVVEKRAIEQSFPQFKFYISGDTLFTIGQLRTRSGITYQIKIIYPTDYPHSCPKVICEWPTVTDAPHIIDGSLCIHYQEWKSNYTIATVIGWTAHWLHSYEVWKRTNRWPGPEV